MKNKDTKTFKRYSQRTAFKFSILPITLAVLLIFIVLFMIFSFNERSEAKEASINISRLVYEDINLINKEINIDSKDSYIKKFIEKEIKLEELYYNFYNLRTNLDLDIDLIIIDEEKTLVDTTTDQKKHRYYAKLNLWQETTLNNGSKIILSLPSRDNGLQLYVKKEFSLENSTYTIFVKINDNSVSNILSMETEAINFIIGKYDQVIATNYPITNNRAYKFSGHIVNSDILEFEQNRYYYSIQDIPSTDLSVISMVKATTFSNMSPYVLLTILAMLILTIVIIRITWGVVNKKNAEAISLMIENIKSNIRNDYNRESNLVIFDEFKPLDDEYKILVNSLEELLTKNQQMIQLNRVDHLALLNSQFNPHFLFNTLESLKYLILLDKEKANKYILDLSKILRYTIKSKDFFVTLEEEIDYVKSYLELQKLRYEDRLDYLINMDEESVNSIVPRLIIQPLIENSIKYTYQYQDDLILSIDSQVIEDNLFIRISDNGPGINNEELEIIKKNFGNYISNLGIGLYNVNKKLDLLYDDYDFDIENGNPGIKITLRLKKD